MTTLKMRASFAVLALALAGCSTPVPQALNPSDVPAKFDGPIPSDVGVWPAKEWWHGFASTELDGFISEAETNNLDIAVAVANVLQAQAQANVQRAALFPALTLDPTASRQQTSASRVKSSGLTLTSPATTFNTFGVQADASYQLDIWGLARDNLRAAEETLKSSSFAQEEVTLTTVSDVGTTYLDVLALREEVDITKQNIKDSEQVLQVTEAKLKFGVASQLDLATEQAIVEQQKANLPVLQEQEREARLALAILLGRAPEGFEVVATNLSGIKTPLVAPGLPSEFLLRRPDVAEAEANLASAHANVDAARAAFFPAVSLTGTAGTSSNVVGTLFHASTFEWSAGASALQTLFDAGKLFAQSDLTKAAQLSLVATYRKTVISAFSNAETAMSQVSNFQTEQEALEREVAASTNAVRISELQYRQGIVDITTVIQNQQTLFSAQNALVQAKLAHAQAVIGLYQALGGGWKENPEDNNQMLNGTRDASLKAPVPNPQDSIWIGISRILP